MKKENKFLLNVEEMKCDSCKAITGHVLTGKYWTCCNCGDQLGKPVLKIFKKLYYFLMNGS